MLFDGMRDEAQIEKSLAFDYEQIEPTHRHLVIESALEIKAHYNRVKEDILYVGKSLIEIKELLPHGQFHDWAETEFGMTPRNAQLIMNVARVYGDKCDLRSLLSYTAMRMLAAPSVPQEARLAAENEAKELGKSPKTARIREIIASHKLKQTPSEPGVQQFSNKLPKSTINEAHTDDNQEQIGILRTLPPNTVQEESGSHTNTSDDSIVYVQDSYRTELELDEQPDIVQVSIDIEIARAWLKAVKAGSFEHLTTEHREVIQNILERVLD